MTPILLAGPAAEPVSLAEAKAWMRIDADDEDDLVGALVTSARLIVESATRRLLMTQSWRLSLDGWPRGNVVRVPLAPFQSLAGLQIYDSAGAARPVAASSYTLDAAPDAARILFTAAPPAPGAAAGGIAIDVVVGYGDRPRDVPAPLRQAILALAARWFEDRGDVASPLAREPLPASVAAMIAPWRRPRLA